MKQFFALAALALLTACATITGSTDQLITVTTTPAGATCSLQNKQGDWVLAQTPGSVKVDRSFSPLVITCSKPGVGGGTATLEPSTSGRAYPDAILLGFPAFIDAGTGAGYDYENSSVSIALH